MAAGDPGDITELLHAWRKGDRDAVDRLVSLVYDELRALARRHLRRERQGHTLQTTALLHEAWLRLAGSELNLEDRRHFFAMAATTMRRVLVDHARARRRLKRGGEYYPVSLSGVAAPESPVDVLDLDDALERLARQDARKARAVELHYFGGLSYDETAAVLGISEATVHRDLRFARSWLHSDLGGTDQVPS